MSRPKKHRCLRFKSDVLYFKPHGISLRHLEEVELQPDELEALKLYEVDDLNQIESAKKMGISQPTFMRIVDKATRKVVTAIVKGQVIKIKQNNNLCYGKHS